MQENLPLNNAQILLSELIGYDTTSRNSNLNLIKHIEGYLKTFGIQSKLIHDSTGNKANLLARIGPDGCPGIMLSGHTDVVPVDGQKWDTSPFKLTKRGSRLLGRGTADMKGFIACVLAMVPAMARAKLKSPIYFAFSYDEEVGCVGVRSLIKDIKAENLDIRACIIGEPTLMRPVIAHKGKTVRCYKIAGKPAHSSYAPGFPSAIDGAALLISKLHEIARREEESGGKTEVDFEYPCLTINVGQITGGSAINIVAEKCEFLAEFRYPYNRDPSPIFEEIEEYIETGLVKESSCKNGSVSVEWNTVVSYPAFEAPDSSDALKLIRSLISTNQYMSMDGGTEAGLFQNDDIDSIIIGPGDLRQAHQPNEFIQISEMQKCLEFLNKLICEVSSNE